MTKASAVRGVLAGFVLLVGVTRTFAQTPPPAQLLGAQLAPKMDDLVISTPTQDELAKCTVEVFKGTNPGSSGYILKDASGKLVRRVFDANGDGHIDVWSYFKDGVEVYREFDTTYKNHRPNNFRWLNSGGTKWGVGSVDPRTGKGVIEYWRMISAEEVGYEAFQAVARQDYNRLKLLFISDAEMQSLKMPAAVMKTIATTQQNTLKKFADLTKKVNLAGARFERLEGFMPGCRVDDAGESMIISYASRAIQYQDEQAKKVDWLHTGEMIQVGMAWRLVDAPSDVDPLVIQPPSERINPILTKLLNDITELDKKQPAPQSVLANHGPTTVYLTQRIPLVEQILPLDEPKQREMWYKQLFDNMTALAQNTGDEASMGKLTQLKETVVRNLPDSTLAAYGTYREMWTRYAVKVAKLPPDKAAEMADAQEKWIDRLGEFVKRYPKGDDTGEALYQMGVGCEGMGKEAEAKRAYTQLYQTLPQHGLAPRARGCVARLDLQGSAIELTGPLLQDSSKQFDIRQLKGKIVIVHYWASDSTNYADDFVRLKRVVDQANPKVGVELVSVNLDDRADTAREALKRVSGTWTHLYQPPSNNSGGGLNSPLAIQYGIHMLPTTFMVGRDGRVTNRALPISDVETELKKIQ
jgi:hypothetical protein